MNNIATRKMQCQRGYLMEVPLLLCLILVTLAILIPHLSMVGRKIFLSIAAVPVLFAAYYMIVIPGWRPGNNRRLGPLLRWLMFLLLAIAIVTAVIAFDLS